MIKKIKKFLLPSNQNMMKMEKGQSHEFSLLYKDLEVGTLEYRSDKWRFTYTEDFKSTKSIKPLANFPTIDKVYESESLWPFFSSRIPSLSRKRVKALIDEKGILESDLLALLKFFGTRTISNPFVLKAS